MIAVKLQERFHLHSHLFWCVVAEKINVPTCPHMSPHVLTCPHVSTSTNTVTPLFTALFFPTEVGGPEHPLMLVGVSALNSASQVIYRLRCLKEIHAVVFT